MGTVPLKQFHGVPREIFIAEVFVLSRRKAVQMESEKRGLRKER